MQWDGFPNALSEMKIGQKFRMLRYDSMYMRIATGHTRTKITLEGMLGPYTHEFDEDGLHLPIVDIATGRLFWMSRQKPVSPVEISDA